MEPPFHIHSIVKKARCDRLPSVQESAQARQSVSSPASESESESESVRVWFFFFVLSFVEGEADRGLVPIHTESWTRFVLGGGDSVAGGAEMVAGECAT
jgi:hypothetical protein